MYPSRVYSFEIERPPIKTGKNIHDLPQLFYLLSEKDAWWHPLRSLVPFQQKKKQNIPYLRVMNGWLLKIVYKFPFQPFNGLVPFSV
jgi:hypothetical protein